MENKRIFIGTDVSKLTIDFTVLIDGQCFHQQIDNNVSSIKHYLKDILSSLKVLEEELFVGIENTGRYCWPVLQVLSQTAVSLYLLAPLHVKKSMGMVRGKNDAIDSERIARFMGKNVDELQQYQQPSETLQQLSLLLSRRNKLQRLIRAEMATKEEVSHVKSSTVKTFILNESKSVINTLKKKILGVEKQIEALIKNDETLSQKVKLMISVPGVGKVLSWYLLVKTNEFKNITDPRKLACYAGVAPFDHSSGTSVRGKSRVSHFADKMLKKILHLAAMRVVQLEGEMRTFYLRKVQEGKNKMTVINALRNKIIHRVMAVINQNRPYQKDYQNHLVLS